ncbi:RNA helicase [Aphelenchoides besseyi]|nr:RNA helicase [Aphelenchoides besseyi]
MFENFQYLRVTEEKMENSVSPDIVDVTCIVNTSTQKSNAKRKHRQRGKLRKQGFEQSVLDLFNQLQLNEEGYQEDEHRQLADVRVEWLEANKPLQRPLQCFEEVEINRQIKINMNHCRFVRPLPIQKYVIPYIVNTNADMIVEAQVGSGKTLAFVLPIVQKIYELKLGQDQSPNRNAPYAVIVAPIRELVDQLAAEATKFTQSMPGVRVAYGYGDLDMRDSMEMLNKGCDLLFVTPGRLHHYFLEQYENRGALLKMTNIRYVVLDEADHILSDRRRNRDSPNNMNNLPNSGEIVEKFVNELDAKFPTQFRVLMFSATLEQKEKIRALVVPSNCISIKVGSNNSINTIRRTVVEILNTEDKMNTLVNMLLEIGEKDIVNGIRRIRKTLIFVNDIRISDRIAASLLDKRFNVRSINSGRAQRQRYEVMEHFKKGLIDIMVATDVASRGLNINKLDFVINYDIPRHFARNEFYHRIGRCGRVGNAGFAITFYDPKTDKHAEEWLEINN